MHSRQEVEPETLKRIASQIAGIPISNKEAAEHAIAVEAFMRIQVANQVAITPDIQFMVNPALNPEVSSMWLFGVRGRLNL